VALIPGISHGFLQFVGVFPEGWKYIFRCGRWIEHIFAEAEEKESRQPGMLTPGIYDSPKHHMRRRTESSGDEDMGLEMSMSSSRKGKDKLEQSRLVERRRKEKLLREEMDKKRGESVIGKRKKSLVSLASSDDLLSRRMAGMVGGLTGRGDDGNADG